MKYLKLFENWLNEADANFDMIKAFIDRFQKNGFGTSINDGFIGCSTQTDAYKISSDVTYSIYLQILDKQNPSNKKLEGGITFNSDIRHKDFFLDGRWTLNPIELLTIDNTVLQEAMAVKQLINSKFGEYLNKYGWLTVDGSTAYFNGKRGNFSTESANYAKWATKDMKANFTPEEIKMMKKHPFEARGVLEKILKEVESTGKNLFKFELGASGPLESGYKLCSSAKKDVYNAWKGGAREVMTAKDLADNIQDFNKDLRYFYGPDSAKSQTTLNSRGPRDAGLNNILYMAIGYAIAKATLIETLYNQKTKLALALAGVYGNSDNKYKPELLAKWDKVSGNLMANLGVKSEEVNLYAPNSPMRAPKDLESPGSADMEDEE